MERPETVKNKQGWLVPYFFAVADVCGINFSLAPVGNTKKDDVSRAQVMLAAKRIASVKDDSGAPVYKPNDIIEFGVWWRARKNQGRRPTPGEVVKYFNEYLNDAVYRDIRRGFSVEKPRICIVLDSRNENIVIY